MFASAVIVFHVYSYFDYFLLVHGLQLSRAYAYYAIFALATVYLVVGRQGLNVLMRQRAIVGLASLYLLMLSVQYAFSNYSDHTDVYNAYIGKVQFVLLMLSSLILFELGSDFWALQKCLTVVALFSSLMNVVEFFQPSSLPWQLSMVPGRAAGFYENPNSSALFIALIVPLLTVRRSLPIRVVLYATTGLGVFFTFSRGGWALWATATAMSELLRVNWRQFRLTSNVVLGTGFAVIALPLLVTMLSPSLGNAATGLIDQYLDTNTSDRLSFFMNDTTVERLGLAREGWQAFLAAPMFGNGIGYTFQWQYGFSVHNMYILTLAEQGLIGFVWLVAFFAAIARQSYPYGVWIAALACVASLTTHNLFDGGGFGIALAAYLAAGDLLPRRLWQQPMRRKTLRARTILSLASTE